MKTTIITILFLVFTLSISAQTNDELDNQVDTLSALLNPQNFTTGFYSLKFGGAGGQIVAISVDNIVGYENWIPFIDYEVSNTMKIKWLGNIDEDLNGFFKKGYTEYIYDVDGKLYLTSEDKKALSSIDWRDIESFTFIPKRKAKQIYGKIGRKGAVLIKTKIDNNINNQ